ncbi:hypothetical protein LDENG_00279750 [Lucifuga dentata]|nr:hypothetical protein LDENG_00279750 [Lucifuga dentata]
MLFLPLSTYQSCSVGTASQCKDAEFPPGTNLAGEGFDITTLNRKAAVIDMTLWNHQDETCTLCPNPYVAGKKQKLPLSVVNWRANQVCSMKVSSQIHKTSESLIRSRSSEVENNWKLSLNVNTGNKSDLLILAGTQSKLAEFSMEKTKNDRFSFISHNIKCQYYSYQVSRSPKLHRKFQEAVDKLPKTYSIASKRQYYELIDSFGTHYITKVKLGGSVQTVTYIRPCQASLKGYSVEDLQKCLDMKASATTAGGIDMEAKPCKKISQKEDGIFLFSNLFDDRFTEIKGGVTAELELLFSNDKYLSTYKQYTAYKNWLNTLPQNPDVISYSLAALHELLPVDTTVQKNLQTAVSHYILDKALLRDCSAPCQPGTHSDDKDPCICHCYIGSTINADCCPTRKSMARVIITVQRGTNLWGDYVTATDGYMKVFFNGQMVRNSPVINNNNNPHWNMVVNLGIRDLSEGRHVRLEVWDQDHSWDDDLLGECQNFLAAGMKEEVCDLQYGRLYYKWAVRCAPSLTGETCKDYDPSPMKQSLKNMDVPRYSHPTPAAL